MRGLSSQALSVGIDGGDRESWSYSAHFRRASQRIPPARYRNLNSRIETLEPSLTPHPQETVRLSTAKNLECCGWLGLLVEKNPAALTAGFDIYPGTDANMSTNVKMGQSSNVYALAKVGDKFFYAVKEVKVTLGGCGG